ncbi:hypothetical protein [Cohnella sp.]|uniref:hypothetical protein n=1 Tax=Cohnella sp. TaxID=1883426 RepID=UPI003561C51F
MGFVVIFVMAWLAVFIFYTMDKSLSIIENAFVYLIILTIGINISWVVAEELKLVELTKDGLLYAGFILYRSIVIPMIFVIMFNAVYKVRFTILVILLMGVALGTILAVNGLMLFYGIFHYKQWYLFYDLILIVLMQAASFALLKLYRRVIQGEVKVS